MRLTLILTNVLPFVSQADSEKAETAIPQKPFHRVLVLSGNGLNSALTLGIVQGLENKGWKPDLILATCGSSIPAVALKAKGNLKDAKALLLGDDFRNLMQSVTVGKSLTPFVALDVYLDSTKAIPHVFQTPILKVPSQWPATARDQDLTKKFDEINNSSPAVALLAGHAYFDKQHSGAIVVGRKLIRESFLTDSRTGYLISQNIHSALVADAFPENYIDNKIEVHTNLRLFQAARASSSDPYLLEPFLDPNSSPDRPYYYLTGAVDLFPVDTAKKLGDEVIAVYGTSFNDIEVRANRNMFGYSTQKRLRQMTREKIYGWVDLSDDQNWATKIGFDPKVGLLSIRSSIPQDKHEFEMRTEAQWQLGVQRGEEALSYPPGDLSHIRSPAE